MKGVILLNLFSDSLRAVIFFNIDHKVVHNIRPTFEGDPLLLWTILNLPDQNLHFFVIFYVSLHTQKHLTHFLQCTVLT